QFLELGPEPLSDEFTYPIFLQRLKKHRGMVKNVLVTQNFLAGIGNAYADEILFAAHILPFRKVTELSPSELERLYQSLRFVLEQAIEHLSTRVVCNIEDEIRDFLKVHGKGGEPCPVCGHPISEITANRKITHFCRHCQH
ncbi:MAG: hypothetical protein ONB05_06675, partial [candidate division KSB1 bacterium]|nr:hypothetical protein [candidate division KSB1 bacterium]